MAFSGKGRLAHGEPMEPGTLLRIAREQAGLSQITLAERANTISQTISKLETGQRKLTLSWAKKLSPIVHVPVENLVSGQPPLTGAQRKLQEILPLLTDAECASVIALLEPAIAARRAAMAQSADVSTLPARPRGRPRRSDYVKVNRAS